MKHLGSITQINGGNVEPVDIITFGSPCQDLSVAGNQKGIEAGERSSLFFEAIRIIREMRETTNGAYPAYAVWENVPGAYSSHGGNDFRLVLEALARISEAEVSIPLPEKGKWQRAGEIVGDGWSIAWRTLDAQFWGVPQRRKRIYLVADFGSECAGEILFEREGVSRNFASGFLAGETSAGHPANRAGTAVAFEPGAASRLGGHCWTEHAGTLRADAGDNQTAVVIDHTPVAFGIGSMDSEGMKSDNPLVGFYEAQTARTIDRGGGNPSCRQGGIAICAQSTVPKEDNASVAYTMTTGEFTHVCREQSPCLQARDYKDPPIVGRQRYTVRRLTPSECAKLQGFPDDWCAGLETPTPTEDEITWWAQVFETHRRIMGVAEKPKSRKQIIKWLKNPYSDAAEYKLWGNGVALPCVCFTLRGITELVATEQQKIV